MTRFRNPMFWAILTVGTALSWALLPPRSGESKSPQKARILSTASVTGEVVPCG